MRKTLLGVSLLTLTIFCIAQDANIFNRINGVNFRGKIYVNIDERRTFYYVIDKEDDPHQITEDLYFKIKNNHKNDFQVYIQFYNPLSTSIKSAQKDLDDPAYTAITSFISKLPSLPQTEAQEATDKLSLTEMLSVDIKESTLLNEWLYKFISLIDLDYIKHDNKEKELKAVVETLSGIEDTENYLYSTYIIGDIDGTQRNINDWAKFANESLYDSDNDYDKFTTALVKSKKVKDESGKFKATATTNLSNIIIYMTKDFDVRIKPVIAKRMNGANEESRDAKDIDAFKKYSSAFAKSLAAITKPQFTLQDAVLKQMEDLNNKLDKFIADFTIIHTTDGKLDHYKKDYSYMLDWKSTKMKSFTFTSQGINKDGSEDVKSANNSTFVVSKKLGVYPFISTGVLFTNLSYPQYAISTTNGVNTVVKTGEEHVYVRPTAFLNLLFSSWDPIYPFAQIGITTGKSDVLFPAGIGASFGSSFSFSFGCIFGYYKELDKLKIDATVKDDAALQSDLTQKPIFHPYFSLSYNIGKK